MAPESDIDLLFLLPYKQTAWGESVAEAILYCLGLIAVCAINYVIFSVSTLYYVGYPLLVAYTAFALWRYFSKSRQAYLCGHCGHRLPSKGICPRCGYRNV